MSASFFNRKPANVLSQAELREVYYGANPSKVAERQQKQLEKNLAEHLEEGGLTTSSMWEVKLIKGLMTHARLRTQVLGKTVEVLVYKGSSDDAGHPVVDICIPARQDVHLTMEMLEKLKPAIEQATLLLNE